MPSDNLTTNGQQVIYLHPAEASVPVTVLHEFFIGAGLDKPRAFLWHWLRHTLTGNYLEETTIEERKELLDFYEQLQRLLEAAYLISLYQRQQQKKQPTATKK